MPASDMGKDDDDQRQGAGENALRRVSEGVRMQTIRRQVYIYLFLIGTGAYFVAVSGLERMYRESSCPSFHDA